MKLIFFYNSTMKMICDNFGFSSKCEMWNQYCPFRLLIFGSECGDVVTATLQRDSSTEHWNAVATGSRRWFLRQEWPDAPLPTTRLRSGNERPSSWTDRHNSCGYLMTQSDRSLSFIFKSDISWKWEQNKVFTWNRNGFVLMLMYGSFNVW